MPIDINKLLAVLPSELPVLLGLSGGLDSTVLLHMLRCAGFTVQAVHINHQISPNANAWESHCETLCKKWDVPFVARRVQVARAGKGLEEAARAARYAVFEEMLNAGTSLVTGHHQNDQAETLLLRLLRGAGVNGLTGIHRQRSFGPTTLYRPLLLTPRNALESYAREHDLLWIEDESNRDQGFDRNFLRAQVMPVLAQRWPDFATQWQQSADHCAEASELLAEVAKTDLKSIPSRAERLGISIELTALCDLTPLRRGNVLRHWLRTQGLVLSASQFKEMTTQIFSSAPDAKVSFRIGEQLLNRYRHKLVLIEARRLADIGSESQQACLLAPGQTLRLAGARVCMVPAHQGLALPAAGHWLVRFKQVGDRTHPIDRGHSQSLKKCLQDAGLEPWLRPAVPLICDPEQPSRIWAVGDLWLDCAAPQTRHGGFRVEWSFDGTENPDYCTHTTTS